jgi:hypothetical protein
MRSPDTLRQHSVHTASPGYLGFTSFSEVYQETRNSLSLAQGSESLATVTPCPPAEPLAAEPTVAVSTGILELCLTVLRHIPEPAVAEPLFNKHINPNDGWIRLAARRVLQSLYATFGNHLGVNRDQAQLEYLARLLCSNTAKTLREDEPDPVRWLASFSGKNFRWESIGILYTYWALGKSSLTTHRPEAAGGASRSKTGKPAIIVFRDGAQLCIEICKHTGGGKGNTLLLYLMYKHAIMESIVSGDASTYGIFFSL